MVCSDFDKKNDLCTYAMLRVIKQQQLKATATTVVCSKLVFFQHGSIVSWTDEVFELS